MISAHFPVILGSTETIWLEYFWFGRHHFALAQSAVFQLGKAAC
jgi:hypothetical protein